MQETVQHFCDDAQQVGCVSGQADCSIVNDEGTQLRLVGSRFVDGLKHRVAYVYCDKWEGSTLLLNGLGLNVAVISVVVPTP